MKLKIRKTGRDSDRPAPVAGEMVMIEHRKGGAKTGLAGFHEGQKVALRISALSKMGFFAVINGAQKGILYKDEVFQPLKIGQEIEGFIKKVREDKKIDLCLQKPGYKAIDSVSRKIVEELNHHGGFIAVTDNSRPKVIADLFGVSKKSFKRAIGSLYKKRLITLEESGIRLRKRSEIDLANVTRKRAAKTPARCNRFSKGFQGSRR